MSRSVARVMTGTALALAVAALLWLNTLAVQGVLALIVAALLASVCAWELDRMGAFRGRGLGVPLVAATLVLLAYEAARVLTIDDTAAIAPLARMVRHYALGAASAFAVALLASIVVHRSASASPFRVALLAMWLLPPLFALVVLDQMFGGAGLFALILLAKIGDNAGYFVGRAIGKRHPFPGISPGKTVAGCVASLVAGTVTGAVVLPLSLGARTMPQVALGALVGGLVNVAAQASDLSESWVKRRAGVKDSSTLVGPSGGVLDVIDSLFFAMPVALCLWTWVYAAPAG